MGSFSARLRLRLFGIDPVETTFARRGFHDGPARARLEIVGQTFVQGYRAALAADSLTELAARLEEVPLADRGFAFEGAAMASCLVDLLVPWRRTRFSRFLAELAAPHIYMAHVGAGLACARLRRRMRPLLQRMDPLLGWLALDGYGFHDGYFHWQRAIGEQRVPRRLVGYERRAFDQGLGRSLWFWAGGAPERAAECIARFPAGRHGDLWSGLGLASAYAGGVDAAALASLRACAGTHLADAAQGVAFAAGARALAGNPAAPTELAASVICQNTATQLAAMTDAERGSLLDAAAPAERDPRFEVWRQRVRVRAVQGPG